MPKPAVPFQPAVHRRETGRPIVAVPPRLARSDAYLRQVCRNRHLSPNRAWHDRG